MRKSALDNKGDLLVMKGLVRCIQRKKLFESDQYLETHSHGQRGKVCIMFIFLVGEEHNMNQVQIPYVAGGESGGEDA